MVRTSYNFSTISWREKAVNTNFMVFGLTDNITYFILNFNSILFRQINVKHESLKKTKHDCTDLKECLCEKYSPTRISHQRFSVRLWTCKLFCPKPLFPDISDTLTENFYSIFWQVPRSGQTKDHKIGRIELKFRIK
jgi:hypothetical protein